MKYLIPIFIAGFFVLVPSVSAYNAGTHGFLTEQSIDFYNKKSDGNKFPVELKNYLIDGALREDDIPRWLNHFYDPVFNRGLTYDTTIDPINIAGKWESSKNWAEDGKNQNSVIYKIQSTIASILSAIEKKKISNISTESDFTWQKAVELYKEGKKEEAMFALGHILHLMEDSSVPDHTRNDPHASGSPYEDWSGRFTVKNPDTELNTRLSNKNLVVSDSLNSLFDGIATYSNNNFYSRDTIGLQSGYDMPAADMSDLEVKGGKYYVMGHTEGSEYPLLKKNSILGLLFDVKSITATTDDSDILKSYWSLLSTKAVQYTAGVLDLFFKKAEAAGVEEVNSTITGADKINEIDEIDVSKPIVFTDRSIVKLGEKIIEAGRNFTVSGRISMIFELPGGKIVNVPVTADAAGSFENIYTIPLNAALGNYVYYAVDGENGATSDKIVYSVVSEINKISTTTVSSSGPPVPPLNSTTTKQIIGQQKCLFDSNGVPTHTQVIFNEIAWMGGSESHSLNSSDEWIELKNMSGSPVDISGWQIINKKESVKIILPTGAKIPPWSFYLLERTDDNSVPNIPADFIYSGGISNSDDGLEILDANCRLIDKVLADSEWPAGDSSLRRTMERKDDFSWYTSGSFNGSVFGTPKSPSGPAYFPDQNQAVVYNPGNSNNQSQESEIPNVMIDEIMYDYPGSDVGHEWVEVKNNGTTTVDFSSLKFVENGIGHNLSLEHGTAAIPSGGYAVISNDAGTFSADFPNFHGNVFSASFTLNNSYETVSLKLGSSVFGAITYSSTTGASGDGNSLQLIQGEWTWSKPTPGADNVMDQTIVGENSGGGGNENNNPMPGLEANHLVISEVQVGGIDDAGDEFIEIYNPTNADISLSGWSLQYVSGGSSEFSSSTTFKKSFDSGSSVKPKKFFLLARSLSNSGDDGYAGTTTPDLYYRSFSLSGGASGGAIFLVSTTTEITSFDETNIVDKIIYGESNLFAGMSSNQVPHGGFSLERKAYSGGQCLSSVPGGEGEFLNNSCDTHNSSSDFETRHISFPQNSQSLEEPRVAPWNVTPPIGKTSIAEYDFENMMVKFSWRVSRDSTDSPSGISYKIFKEISSSTAVEIVSTTSLSFNYSLEEINKNYHFYAIAYDRDNMPSGKELMEVNTPFPSLMPIIYSENVLNSVSLGSSFSDNWYELGRGFSGILRSLTLRGFVDRPEFYASHVYLKEFEDFNYTKELSSFTLSDNAPFTDKVKNVRIENLNIKLNPFSYYRLDTYQDYQNRSVVLLGINDVGRAMSNAFITDTGKVFNYYSFFPFLFMEGDNGDEVDVSIPQKPTKPVINSINFDRFGLNLNLSWSTSTDLDSLDSAIVYEYNITNLADFKEDEWTGSGNATSVNVPISFPNRYKIGVRAMDDTGLKSEEYSTYWEFPQTFSPYTLSVKYNSVSQEFALNENSPINSVTIFSKDFQTPAANPNALACFVKIEDISSGQPVVIAESDLNQGDGQSGPYSARGYACAGEVPFMFNNSSAILYSNRKYRWTYYMNFPEGFVKFYGRNDNLAQGNFSGPDFKNAIFTLKNGSETVFSNF